MQPATGGVPAAGVGYEIFDKSDSFGTTAFVQNVNRLRALEGELARTIRSIESIDSARVHLVIPDRQIFAQTNQSPSASVVVKTRTHLGRGPVTAIQHLVAAAGAGLTPDGVAVIDDKREALGGGPGDGDKTTSDAHEERTASFQESLVQRGGHITDSSSWAGTPQV